MSSQSKFPNSSAARNAVASDPYGRVKSAGNLRRREKP